MHLWASLALLEEKQQLQGVIQGAWCQWGESLSNVCASLSWAGSWARELCLTRGLLLPSHPLSRIASGQRHDGGLEGRGEERRVGTALVFWGGHNHGNAVMDCLQLLWSRSLWVMVYLYHSPGGQVTVSTVRWTSEGLAGAVGADRPTLLLGRFCSHTLSSQLPQGQIEVSDTSPEPALWPQVVQTAQDSEGHAHRQGRSLSLALQARAPLSSLHRGTSTLHHLSITLKSPNKTFSSLSSSPEKANP